MQKNYQTTKPSDFLYERMGPWPQPSPAHPIGESAAVVHLPLKERIDWWIFIGSRYMLTLFYAPVAYLRGIIHPGLKEVSDSDFLDMIENSMLSKFICDRLDETDKKIFAKFISENSQYAVVDLEPVKVVKTFEGIYASGTKTLLKKDAFNKYSVVAIWVEKTNSLFVQSDGDAWELAKYFVLQGGALCATLVIHPLLHFPFDAINAITKTCLPKDHLLFKLIYAHTRFTLPLENAVLTFKTSLLQAKWWMCYAPYPGEKEGLRELLVEGYMGINNNTSYPKFSYPKRPITVHSKYGEFQDAYYEVFRKFVASVISDIAPDDYFVKCWANWISQFVPGFPNGDEVFKDDNLLNAVSYYMWNVSVGHTVDHYNYGRMDHRKIPLRLRQAPPVKGVKMIDRSKLTTFFDNAKYIMAQILFFDSTTVTSIIDIEYNFEKANHLQAERTFKDELKVVDQKMKAQNMQYIPLEKIARSIQS